MEEGQLGLVEFLKIARWNMVLTIELQHLNDLLNGLVLPNKAPYDGTQHLTIQRD
ncbi:hypothetical protein ABVK25_006038 [Lepraria finkii]|uniref:Uncharacterized protein n=1 Tax=Lepraria finkii TaxID=1340010 RepID=A0ABR4BA58_9LECA